MPRDQGHINNLYNTTFWTLIQHGRMDAKEAERELMGSSSAEKNEILFSRFGMNYNNEPEIYKKGSVVFHDYELVEPSSSASPKEILETEELSGGEKQTEMSKRQQEKDRKRRARAMITVQHVDIIKDEFWDRRPWLLSIRPGRIPKEP
ncbi:MAG: tRNA-His guanylyltransferase [Pycnora praestabilis]|nr:MAG: tRNA-His guanylyltransferase [Pycnora praestabilis]